MTDTYAVDGVIFNMRGESSNPGGCLCGCGPEGHIFCYGIRIPSLTVSGISGPQTGSEHDWTSQVLHAHRREDGRKVRITLELLDDEVVTTDA